MISLQRSMHSSQMYTPGPAISFLTCFWLFPQKEHFSRSPPSPIRATGGHPPVGRARYVKPVHRLCADCAGQDPKAPQTVPRAAPDAGMDTRYVSGSGERRDGLARLDHGVDQAVLDRLGGGQDLVTLDVLADLVERTTAVVADHLLEQLAHPQDLVGLDL